MHLTSELRDELDPQADAGGCMSSFVQGRRVYYFFWFLRWRVIAPGYYFLFGLFFHAAPLMQLPYCPPRQIAKGPLPGALNLFSKT